MAKLKQPPLAGTVWLADRCTETYTVRLTGVSSNPALLDDLKLPMDCKEILVHYEGSDVMGYYKGTITGYHGLPYDRWDVSCSADMRQCSRQDGLWAYS